MNLDKYKCNTCNLIQDMVYICKNHHMICEKCSIKSNNKCKCKDELTSIKPNPIGMELAKAEASKTVVAVKEMVGKDCQYKEQGCTWKFDAKNMQNHLMECRNRPFRCIGTILGVWKCDWLGMHLDCEKHLICEHGYTSKNFYSYYQVGSVEYAKNIAAGHKISLIDAFSRKFVFYYRFDTTKKTLKFMIFMMGRQEVAVNYLYNFEIFSKSDSYRKIKFVENCINDSNCITNGGSDEHSSFLDDKCIHLTYDTIKSYMEDDKVIHFRFIIEDKREKAKTAVNYKNLDRKNKEKGKKPADATSIKPDSSSSGKKNQINQYKRNPTNPARSSQNN